MAYGLERITPVQQNLPKLKLPKSQSASDDLVSYRVGPEEVAADAQPPKNQPGFFENVGNLAKKGFENAYDNFSVNDIDSAAKVAAKQATDISYQPKQLTEVKDSFKDEAEDWNKGDYLKSIGGALFEMGKQVFTNPEGMAYFGAEQAANMAAIIAARYPGAIAGGKAGATLSGGNPFATAVGAFIGGGLTGGAAEYNLEAGGAAVQGLLSRAIDAGVDVKNAEAIKAFAKQNPQAWQESLSEGRAKGFWTSLVDQAMMGVSGRIASTPKRLAQRQAASEIVGTNAALLSDKVIAKQVAARADDILKSQGLMPRVKHLGLATANEMVGGMASEAAGQKAAYGDVDMNEVYLEGLGELVTGPVEALSTARETIKANRYRNRQQDQGQAAPVDQAIDGESVDMPPRNRDATFSGQTYDTPRSLPPPAGPIEGDYLGREAIDGPGSSLEPRRGPTYSPIYPGIEGTSQQPDMFARPGLPPPEDGGPTERQIATARGILNHSPRATPETLSRLMGLHPYVSQMLYDHWNQTEGKKNAQGAQAIQSTPALQEMPQAAPEAGGVPGVTTEDSSAVAAAPGAQAATAEVGKFADIDAADEATRQDMLQFVASRAKDDGDLSAILDRLPDPLQSEPYAGNTARIAFAVFNNNAASEHTKKRAEKIYADATRPTTPLSEQGAPGAVVQPNQQPSAGAAGGNADTTASKGNADSLNQQQAQVKETPSDLIFGMTWDEIKARQQGAYQAQKVKPQPLPVATEKDIELLRTDGIEGLRKKEFFGVIDRLQNSGIVPKEGQYNAQGTSTGTAEAVSTGAQGAGEDGSQPSASPTMVPANHQAVTRIKGGKLELTGFDEAEVKEAASKLNLDVRTGQDGKMLVTSRTRTGEIAPVPVKAENALKTALIGKEVKAPKKRGFTGNLRNDLNLLASGLYGEVERGGDGEATGKFDVGMIAESLRDEYGYTQIGNYGDSKAAGEALIDLIRQGGAVSEDRVLAEKEAEDAKAQRVEVEQLADEYGIKYRFRKFADVMADVLKVIEDEIGIASRNATAIGKLAIERGIVSKAEAKQIVETVTRAYTADRRLTKKLLAWREIANTFQDKINEYETRAETGTDAGADGQAVSGRDQGEAVAGEDRGAREEDRPAFDLQRQTRADLAAKTARENDESLAERERIKAESEFAADKFTLQAQEKPVEVREAENLRRTPSLFGSENPANAKTAESSDKIAGKPVSEMTEDKLRTIARGLSPTYGEAAVDKAKAELRRRNEVLKDVARFEIGRSLTKEQKKSVLKTLVDVYKANDAPKEFKGQDQNGNERYGYAYSPEFFVKSDITGAMVRYYVALPDGRIAHPTELFPEYSQSDIDAELERQKIEERNKKADDGFRLKTLNSRKSSNLNEANRMFWKQNPSLAAQSLEYVPALLTNGTDFIRTDPAHVERDIELLGDGWREKKPGESDSAKTPADAGVSIPADPIGWDAMDIPMREELVTRAGWTTERGSINPQGRKVVRRSWADMPQGTRDTLTRFANGDEKVGADKAPGGSSATVVHLNDGGWLLTLFDSDGQAVKEKRFDNKAQAYKEKAEWIVGQSAMDGYSEDGTKIDRAASRGYRAGLEGESIPPFELDDMDAMAWNIGYRRGREDAKAGPGETATTEEISAVDRKDEGNGRNSFTLERLNRDTNEMEQVTFERGEYVRYRATENGENLFGEIDGISHAKREFSVDGLWYPFGLAYKAERPESVNGVDVVPVSSVIDKLNAKYGEGLTDADRIYTLEFHSDLYGGLLDGMVSIEQFKAAFESLAKSKDVIKAELSALTKDAIFKRFPGLAYRYKNDKKADVVDAAYRSMLNSFVLGDSISWSMGEKYEDVIRGYVEKTTEESLREFADRVKATREERTEQRKAAEAGMENPVTLDDYKRILAAKAAEIGEAATFTQARMAMTPEQRARFDELSAEKSRDERRARADQQRTDVRVASTTAEGQVIETKHTKTGEPLFVVKAAERVERDVYNHWNATAKRLGGWYSSFRGSGAVPGFQFKTREHADAFLAFIGGNAEQAKEVVQARRDAFADDHSQSAVERLNEMADRLDEQAGETLSAERKTNTARRARMAAGAEVAAHSQQAMAQTMRNIAAAIESGKAKFLDRVRQKVQIERMQAWLSAARDAELRAKYPSYAEQEKHKGAQPTGETADYAEFPNFTAYRSDLARMGRRLLEIDGAKLLGQRLLKVADDVTTAYKKFAKENLHKVSTFKTQDGKAAVFRTAGDAEAAIARSGFKGKATTISFKRGEHLVIMGPEMAKEAGFWQGDDDKRITLSPDLAEEIVAKAKGRDIGMPWTFEAVAADRARLKAMGIEMPAEFRAALREFIAMREAPKASDRVKELERKMIGRANDGLDFFPTPAETARAMIDTADLKEGVAVLEPSAGWGHIAEKIREAGVEPDVVELSGDRRELLDAKGFNLVGNDFMDAAGEYDRIIMNPPFGDRRDAEHVQHAYSLLKPGGRIVALMGEGVFFGQDKKAQAFRDWLDSVGGTSEKLEYGTFLDPSLPVNTGVNARMVVIDRKETNSGVAMFNAKSGSWGNPIDTAALEATIARVISGSPSHFSRDTVVTAPLFADLPAPILAKAKKEGYDSNGRKPNGEKLTGATYDGKVYLVQENISSELEAEETLLHERIHQIVHGNAKDPDGIALRQSLGKLYTRLGAKSGIERMAKEAGIDMTGPLAAFEKVAAANRHAFLAEEFLAHAEGQRAYEKLPAKIKRAAREFWGEFRDWLRGSKFIRIAEAFGAKLDDFTQSDLAWTLKGIRQQEAGTGSKAIRFMTAWHGSPHDHESGSLIGRLRAFLLQDESLDGVKRSSDSSSNLGIRRTVGPHGERLISIPADLLRAANLDTPVTEGGIEIGRVGTNSLGGGIDGSASRVEADRPFNVVGDGSPDVSGSRRDNPSVLESKPNGRPMESAKGISDLLKGGTLLAHLKRIVEIPGQRISTMKSGMIFGGENLKIVDGIIQAIPIDMMNVFVSGKTATGERFNNQPVFILPSDALIENISLLDDIPAASFSADSGRLGHGIASHIRTSKIRKLENVVKRFIGRFPGASALAIRVVESNSDLPPHVKASKYAEAIFLDDYGQIFMIADNVASEARAFQILLHEAVGHYGLAAMMGERFSRIVARVKDAAHAKGKLRPETKTFSYQPGDKDYATVEAVKLRYPDATESEIAQEVLARMAETDPGRTLFGYVRAMIRQWLRDTARALGIDLNITTAELNDLVALASAYMRRGDNLAGEFEPTGMAAASKRAGLTDYQYRADQLERAFEKMGLSVRRDSSRVSQSEYVEVESPEYTASEGERGETLKFRVSDHELPSGYSQPDFDVIADGVEHGGVAWNRSGTWVDAVEWLSELWGVPVPPTIKAVKSRAITQAAKDSARLKRQAVKYAEERLARFDSAVQSGTITAKRSGTGAWMLEGMKASDAPILGRHPGVPFSQDAAIAMAREKLVAEIEARKREAEGAPTPDSRELGSQTPGDRDAGAASLRADESGQLEEPAQSGSGAGSNATLSEKVGAGKTARGMESRRAGMESRAAPSNAQGPIWNSPDASRADDVIYTMQDKNIDLKRVQQAIKEALGNIRDDIDAYLQEELFHGRAAKATEEFLERELNPFIGEMKQRSIDMETLENFLWARHAKERNAQIAKINPDMPDGGSGLTDRQADALMAGKDVMVGGQKIAGIPQDKLRSLNDLARKVDMMTAGNRMLLELYELETPETVAAWKAAYKHYVPLHREDADAPWAGNGSGQGYSVKGASTKRATGSFRPVENILANIAMQRTRTITRGEKNRVAQAMYGLAQSAPNPEVWEVDKAPTIRVVKEMPIYKVMKNGVEIGEFTRMQEAEKAARNGGDIYQTWGERVVEQIDPTFRSQPNVVWARFGGEDKFIVFNEHNERALRMAESLKNLDNNDIGELMGEMARWTRYFAAINTQYNPVFGVVNLIRDVGAGAINLKSTPLAGQQPKLLTYTWQALPAIFKAVRTDRKGGTPTGVWAGLWEEFQEIGGKTGYRDMFRNSHEQKEALEAALDPTFWQRKWWGKTLTAGGLLAVPEQFFSDKIGKPVFALLSDFNTMMENGVRLAAYKMALDMGMSKERAASLGKNLTVNFNRKGQITRQAGAMYAFFNASVQGTARIAETLRHGAKPGEMLGKAGKQIILGGLMLGVIQAMLLMAAGFDDEDPPGFVKDRALIFPIPFSDKRYLSLPLPLGFNILPAFGRIMTEFVLGGFKDPGKRLTHMFDVLMDSTNPLGNSTVLQTGVPTVFDPIAALAENTDWSGKPIYREDFSKTNPTPGFTRTKDTASNLSKGLAWLLNMASGGTEFKQGLLSPTPDQIDYLLGQVTGGVGRELGKVDQTVSSLFTGEELPAYKIPLIGRLYGQAGGKSGEGSRFYDNLRALNEHQAEIQGLQKTGRAKQASEYIKKNPESILFREADRMQRMVSQLQSRKREMKANDAPREDIRKIDDQITRLMRQFNQRVAQRSEQSKH